MSFLLGPFEALESGLFESKPNVPQYHWTDLLQQQMDTTQGNLDVLPSAEKLGAGVNDFMRGERAKTLAGIPGLGDIESETAANLKSWLRGELPSDVSSAVQRGANARAYAGGYGGSGMGRDLTSRDLGLTSLDISRSAVPLASQYMGQEYNMRKTPEFDPSSMFLDPRFSAQFNNMQNQQQYQRDLLAAKIAAQPEPWQQSLMNSTQSLGGMMDSALALYGGGMMGGIPGMGGRTGSAAGGGFNMNNYNQLLESGQLPY